MQVHTAEKDKLTCATSDWHAVYEIMPVIENNYKLLGILYYKMVIL